MHGKLQVLRERLAALGSAVIGFSGGVDSAFLAAVARGVLGRDRAPACLAVSPSLPARERAGAEALAAAIDLELIVFEGTEFANPAYVANGPDRCFHCKTDLFVHLRRIAAGRGHARVLYGANADDGLDYRPGLRAALEQGALAPLAEAALTKAEIRALAREMGLSVADKPASPCLSSRIPYGSAVTREKLAAVEAGEALLREMGFREFRVRHQGDTARIEVPLDELPRLSDPALAAALEAGLKSLGFSKVAADPKGFRSGSLNEALPEAVKRRGA